MAVSAGGSVLKKGFQSQHKITPGSNTAAIPGNTEGKESGDASLSLSQEIEKAARNLYAKRNDAPAQPPSANGPVLQKNGASVSELLKDAVKPAGVKNGEIPLQPDAKTADNGFEPVISTSRPDLAQRSEADLQMVRKIQQVVRQELQSNLSADKAWKLHNFSMNDGSRIQLAFRQLEGILQLQLSSMNQDLNRLIQMNVQEIRDYLQNEMGLDIDLQFDENRFTNGDQSEGGEPAGTDKPAAISSERLSSSRTFAKENTLDSMRFFGFNDNEWTA